MGNRFFGEFHLQLNWRDGSLPKEFWNLKHEKYFIQVKKAVHYPNFKLGSYPMNRPSPLCVLNELYLTHCFPLSKWNVPQAENLRRPIALKDVRKRADDLGENSGEITFSFKKGETYGKNNTAEWMFRPGFLKSKTSAHLGG